MRAYNNYMGAILTGVCEEVPEGEGGGYVAYVAELPGAISEGDTLEEAHENLRDAISLCFWKNADLPQAARKHRTLPDACRRCNRWRRTGRDGLRLAAFSTF